MNEVCGSAPAIQNELSLPQLTPVADEELSLATTQASLPVPIQPEVQVTLLRMFRDPYVLEEGERTELITQLKSAVENNPQIPEFRVLLGMALCVDLKTQPALDQLRTAVAMAPDNFMARLKLGELLMRLRICDQAEDQTREAAKLAVNTAQADLARRQAATLRTMRREGIERGGYKSLLGKLVPLRRFRRVRRETGNSVALELS